VGIDTQFVNMAPGKEPCCTYTVRTASGTAKRLHLLFVFYNSIKRNIGGRKTIHYIILK
jgi:hypothetical protein